MFRTQEADDPEGALVDMTERPQEQRLPGAAEAYNKEGRDAGACPDVTVPGRKQVEALIGGGEQRAVFERPPAWLGPGHGIEHFQEVACVRELLHAAFAADGRFHPGFRICARQY